MSISVKNIVPLSTFRKNTSAYVDVIRKSSEPVILTINGSAALVVEEAEKYEALVRRNAYMEQELSEMQQAIALKALLDDRASRLDESKLLTVEEARDKIKAKARI